MGQLLCAYTTEENVSHLPSIPQLYKHPVGEGEVEGGMGGVRPLSSHPPGTVNCL